MFCPLLLPSLPGAHFRVTFRQNLVAVVVPAPHWALYTLVSIAILINEHNWARFTDEDAKAETGKLFAQGHDLTPKFLLLLPLGLSH